MKGRDTHTPGPWSQDPTGDLGWWVVGTPEAEVCNVAHYHARDRAARGNARVIAAAPDLLDACREAVNVLADYIPTLEAKGASLNYGRTVVGQLLLAIARAEGR